MEGPKERHTKWSKSNRGGEILNDIPYMWNLKEMIQTNLRTKQKDRKQTSGCSMRGGIVRDFGTLMYTLWYLKRITSKNLLCSTWNSAQRDVQAWMGGGGREWTRVYGQPSPFASHLKRSQRCQLATPQYKIKHWRFGGNACIKVHLKKW